VCTTFGAGNPGRFGRSYRLAGFVEPERSFAARVPETCQKVTKPTAAYHHRPFAGWAFDVGHRRSIYRFQDNDAISPHEITRKRTIRVSRAPQKLTLTAELDHEHPCVTFGARQWGHGVDPIFAGMFECAQKDFVILIDHCQPLFVTLSNQVETVFE
jgi:hypothetical protein